MSERQQLEGYLDVVNPELLKNVTIVGTCEDNTYPLYRIVTDGKATSFKPKISRRTALKEDRTVPRVSASNTLLGCLLGYQGDIADFEYGYSDN